LRRHSPRAAIRSSRRRERLLVAEATVKGHVGSVLLNSAYATELQAVAFAYEHGIVVAADPG
jgi:hypothetical protein